MAANLRWITNYMCWIFFADKANPYILYLTTNLQNISYPQIYNKIILNVHIYTLSSLMHRPLMLLEIWPTPVTAETAQIKPNENMHETACARALTFSKMSHFTKI